MKRDSQIVKFGDKVEDVCLLFGQIVFIPLLLIVAVSMLIGVVVLAVSSALRSMGTI